MSRCYLVIDLFYPSREQGFLALVDLEGAKLLPPSDHALVPKKLAEEDDAHFISDYKGGEKTPKIVKDFG